MYWNNSAWKSLVFKNPGLTLTWDVLKYFCPVIIWGIKTGLTLTWDVLKLGKVAGINGSLWD